MLMDESTTTKSTINESININTSLSKLISNNVNINFSKEQQISFDKYIQGENVFITGPGGTGKSYLIKQIYSDAILRGKRVQVTALTGCAAILLACKAKTLHSWSGIGLGNNTTDNLILKIKKNKFLTALWKETDILIVDEVSMLSLKLFNLLNAIGKAIRRCSSKSFGGIQLLFFGDFYQLPPVGNKEDPDTQRFCFESDDWNSTFRKNCQIQLLTVYRQTDATYVSILNQIREGKLKRKSVELLIQYVGREYNTNDDKDNLIIEPTKLFPTRNKVSQINNFNMGILQGEYKEYEIKWLHEELTATLTKQERIAKAQYSVADIQNELDYLTKSLPCDHLVKLKIGAQVMSIINIMNTIPGTSSDFEGGEKEILVCNGSQGIITGYCEITECPRVKFHNGIEMVMSRHVWTSEKIPGVGVSQIPLILAWALTIHKSQGVSLDIAEIDIGSGIFESGQTYVALSRVKNLQGLYITSFDVSKIKINKKVKGFYEALTL
jgi:ATP-dependent DNA helicase PIF1